MRLFHFHQIRKSKPSDVPSGTERLIYKTTDGEAPSKAMENDKLNRLNRNR